MFKDAERHFDVQERRFEGKIVASQLYCSVIYAQTKPSQKILRFAMADLESSLSILHSLCPPPELCSQPDPPHEKTEKQQFPHSGFVVTETWVASSRARESKCLALKPNCRIVGTPTMLWRDRISSRDLEVVPPSPGLEYTLVQRFPHKPST